MESWGARRGFLGLSRPEWASELGSGSWNRRARRGRSIRASGLTCRCRYHYVQEEPRAGLGGLGLRKYVRIERYSSS